MIMCRDRKNNLFCSLFTFFAGLLLSAGIGILFYFGLITSITTLIVIALILGILGIVISLVSIFCANSLCECIKNSCILESSIASLILSAIALASTALTTFSIPIAIVIAAISFLLFYNIVNWFKLLLCIFCRNDCYKDCYKD